MKIDIIGGGIIGMSAAYFLSKQGARVRVFEKDKSYSTASFARSCGGLRAQFFTPQNILMSRYSVDFIKNHTNVKFTPNGYLMLFGKHQQEDCDYSSLLQFSLGATTKILLPNELEIKYPWMFVDDIYKACYTDDGSEGWVDPIELHTWFKTEAEKLGAKFTYNDGLKEIRSADAIIIASGCWSGEVGRYFGLTIPVQGHKHTVYNITTQYSHIPSLPLIADLINGVYLRPEGNGYIVGYEGNGEWGAVDLDPNMDPWTDVWERLYSRGPEVFEGIKVRSAWAGYYDASLIDSNAIIDNVNNVYFATGFTGRGLMHSPAVGLTLMEMIYNLKTTFDLTNFKLVRRPQEEKYVI